MGTRCADHVPPLYPQKLALTSPTGGGRSVGIVRVRTKATEFFYILSVFFSSKCSLFHNSNIFGSVLVTFYIQGVLKLENNSVAKRLMRILQRNLKRT